MSYHRIGIARNQTAIFCLEDFIAADNIVRVIDAFVDILDMEQLGFAHIKAPWTGSPPYHPALLLKIYLYGYLNRVRSSRKLETECERNVEMRWLCHSQVPCYHTISSFRTFKNAVKNEQTGETVSINHQQALKEVFRSLNRFLNGQDLFGKKMVATDGTKIRAQNAKKKNYTLDKLNKKIELSDSEIDKFMSEMAANDAVEATNGNKTEILSDMEGKLKELKNWNETYKAYKWELERRSELDPEVTQISLTDPDARSIVINNTGHSEVAFNIVTTGDDKHCLIADFKTHNIKDTTLLAQSLITAKAEFDTDFDPNLYQHIPFKRI